MNTHREKLKDIIHNGLAVDLYHADEALSLDMFVGRYANEINKATFGAFFGNLQIILTRNFILHVARMYEQPKKPTRRNPNPYPIRSIWAAIKILKELEFTEGRCTGIPKIIEAMAQNGSPSAEFEFDEDHSYFMVRLPVHPAAREVAESATGQEPGKVGAGETAATGTESGPGWDQVGTKSAPSRHQVEILRKCLADAEIADLMAIAERADRIKFRNQVLKPLLDDNLLAMTIPDKPTSRNQRYRTTDKGRALLATLPGGAA